LRYCYYLLKSKKNEIIDLANYTVGLGHIKESDLKEFEIMLPSIQKQKEIVEKIDTFMIRVIETGKILNLYEKTLILEAKTMYQENKCKMMKLKDIGTFLKKSKRKASDGLENGKYRFYICSNDKIKWCNEADYTQQCIIFGDGGIPTINIDTNFSCSSHNHIFVSNNKEATNVYIYNFIKGKMDLLKNGFIGTTIENISKDYLENLEIPVPSLDIQKQLESDFEYMILTKKKIKEWEEKGNELIQQLSKYSQTKLKEKKEVEKKSNEIVDKLNEEPKQIVKKIRKQIATL
jgi:restriction endonuclease S subunit